MNIQPISMVAKTLGVHLQTARRLANEGKIPGAQRIGRKWFVSADAFAESFGAARKCSPAADRRATTE